MGVPAFYRWLSEKYPKCITPVLESRSTSLSSPNPNASALVDDYSVNDISGAVESASVDKANQVISGEFDNLYIDMNGIIHPCAHPEVGPQPSSESEMFANVASYIDRLVNVCRPREVLYLAIDGVAPRAKMNQQRSRRFKSAQEARDHLEVSTTVREDLIQRGAAVPKKLEKEPWDSNVITPGTEFMMNLSTYIKSYISIRISSGDVFWRTLRVIFSDASIPGEGEHKIMSFVRDQRKSGSYNPNKRHVLHGLDADLIMLGLATHETRFYILREEVLFGRRGAEDAQRAREVSGFQDVQGLLDEEDKRDGCTGDVNTNHKPLQLLSIPVLREYFAFEFTCLSIPTASTGKSWVIPNQFEANFENLIDDVIFLCFFIGNDFLPHLPSLDIREGALDFLFTTYKRLLPGLGSYITSTGGDVNLSHVDVMLSEVGGIEDRVFQMRYQVEEGFKVKKGQMKARDKAAKARNEEAMKRVKERAEAVGGSGGYDNTGKKVKVESRDLGGEERFEKVGRGGAIVNGIVAAKKKKAVDVKVEVDGKKKKKGKGKKAKTVKVEESVSVTTTTVEEEEESSISIEQESVSVAHSSDSETSLQSQQSLEDDDHNDEEEDAAKANMKDLIKKLEKDKLDQYSDTVIDNVKLHESGWRDRYYSDKCKADDILTYSNGNGREELFKSYVVGLCWVMKYYYAGCVSWSWYYPFHYAPFASDLRNIERFQGYCNADSFTLAQPFSPVEQLLGVLPSDSAHAVPQTSRWLMTDIASPISDFYPSEILQDPNGKAMPWLWVVLLPFIQEKRLMDALGPTRREWTETEKEMNARGLEDGYLYVHCKNEIVEGDEQVKAITALEGRTRDEDGNETGTDGAVMEGGKQLNPTLTLGFTGHLSQPLKRDLLTSGLPLNLTHSTKTLSDGVSTNYALCLAYKSPFKTPHLSILLPNSVLPTPRLTQADAVIRVPNLNRGGQTIAQLGGGNTAGSRGNGMHHSGFGDGGSMNVSNFERDVARIGGRREETGTKRWGTMEPSMGGEKRRRVEGFVGASSSSVGGYQGQSYSHGQSQSHGMYNTPPPPHGHPPQYAYQQNGGQRRYSQPPPSHQHQYSHPPPPLQYQQQYSQPPPQVYQRQGGQGQYSRPPPPPPPPLPPQQYQQYQHPPSPPPQQQYYHTQQQQQQRQFHQPPPPPQQQQQQPATTGFSFGRQGVAAPPPISQQQSSSSSSSFAFNKSSSTSTSTSGSRAGGGGPVKNVNSNVMKNLRESLKSTLQNRK